jgi:geranylgeranyl diphosphate synthase type II
MKEKRERIEKELLSLLPEEGDTFCRALHYAVFSGGKRIRPLLCVASAEAVGCVKEEVYRCACAIELIHNYSLVHDDIIDKDETRRGKPSVYKKYGTSLAILVGDGLLTLGFEILSEFSDVASSILPFCGISGMVGGQAEEILSEPKLDRELLERVSLKKTASLFSASCVAGAVIGRAEREEIESLREYGKIFGIIFQIADDIADRSSFITREEVEERVKVLTEEGISHLNRFGRRGAVLCDMIKSAWSLKTGLALSQNSQ